MKKCGIMRNLRGVVLPAVVLFAMVVASMDSCAVEMRGNAQFPSDGGFRIGCNYWASHAGMKMWSRWDAAQVEKILLDLRGMPG